VLAAGAIAALTRDLAAAIGAMGFGVMEFGKPQLVQEAAAAAELTFQGHAKAKPRTEDAYAAARAFLRGGDLDDWQKDMVASAVSEPIREHGHATVLGDKRFPALLAAYEDEAKRGELWRLTWHGLLFSYFKFDPTQAGDSATHQGWAHLRSFLERTWPLIDKQSGDRLVPEWISVLRKEANLLSAKPAEKYALDYLRGDTAATELLAEDLGIPPSSWFWHALVLGAVKRATAEPDAEFRRLVPTLIELVRGNPGFRDEALELILVRYHACSAAPADERLRDFVCHPQVWKNPKLKAAGIATAWNRVPTPVWQMVLTWVNEQNLKDFFDILAARSNADEGRLAFWSRYLKQISWTRLVFGAETMSLARANPAVRDLIAREEGAYAQLTGKREVDAFMMQLGSYLIVEFSKKPNACYVYKSDELPFEPYDKYFDGGTSDLGVGYRVGCAARIIHLPRWETRATDQLKSLGIRPDKADARRVGAEAPRETATTAPHTPPPPETHVVTESAGLDMLYLEQLMVRFRGAAIYDKRDRDGGRLWVEDPLQRVQLGSELEALNFRWADARAAWYYRENR
jgi:hypothetical protein